MRLREWVADRLKALAERVRPERPALTDAQRLELVRRHNSALAQVMEFGSRR